MCITLFQEEFESNCTYKSHVYYWNQDPDIQFEIFINGKVVMLGWIYNSNPGSPGKRGSRALDWICSLADRHQVILELSVCPLHSLYVSKRDPRHLTAPQLWAWYRRRGFIGDYARMTRLPINGDPETMHHILEVSHG